MDMNDWVMLVTALGGIEGIKQLIKWWMSRKTNARIEDAHADVEEFKALREYNEFLQKQLSEKEQRFVEQTDRLGDIDVDDLRLLTREDVVNRVLKPHYWDRWKADDIKSQSVANILVDWVWASGAHGIKIPQRLLGVSVDGIVGPKTLAAVNARNPRELFDMIKIARFDFIEDICRKRPANNKFKRGWMNRINDIAYVG